jgi:HD superfamily phosphohydrolase YqeK
MHGLIGSRFVREKFNCTDKMVLKAIADHVMPPIHSSKLTMIIYCAEKLVL